MIVGQILMMPLGLMKLLLVQQTRKPIPVRSGDRFRRGGGSKWQDGW